MYYNASTVRVRNGSQTNGCKRCSIITLRLHRHLNHAIQLVLEQVVRLGDVGEFVAVRNQWRRVNQLKLAVGYVGVGEHKIYVFTDY